MAEITGVSHCTWLVRAFLHRHNVEEGIKWLEGKRLGGRES
jgi:hypothetical protein